ncbi:MAG: hypothetical protein CVU54_12100 [Deltaproteobacteria bacterium HGW-Deltaproteobacteria-12]|jgi:hypothetical protein|nr:MAG: hypothetical protein CVU54_12100 [Deltaproteobacteria bacterium HGW-Deltaproteobacteria-12]
MIFRLTIKLSKKIEIAPLPVIQFDENRNPILEWNAHLFTAQRTQYIILTNTASLYSILMYGRGITNDKSFVREALSCMHEFMIIDGNKEIFENVIEPESQMIYFSKIIDRRVSGSMNDFIFQAKLYLSEGHKQPFDVSFMLNESPMSYLNYSKPKIEFRKLYLTKDGESPGDGQIKNNVIYIKDVRR